MKDRTVKSSTNGNLHVIYYLSILIKLFRSGGGKKWQLDIKLSVVYYTEIRRNFQRKDV